METTGINNVINTEGTVTITRDDLSNEINEQIGFNKREAKDFVELVFHEIAQSLIQGEEVHLTGFGNFILRDKAARPGRNPRTGAPVPITPRRVVTFHASKKLKQVSES